MDNLSLLMTLILAGALQMYLFGLRVRAQRKIVLKDQKPAKEITLAAFVNRNAKLLTTVGVFVALTGFSASFQIKPLGYILSFLSLLIAITLFVELWRVSILGFKTPLLHWFLDLLSLILLVLTVYWLIQFRTIVEAAIRPALYAIGLFLVSYSIWSCPFLKRFMLGQTEQPSQQSLALSPLKWFPLVALTILLFLFVGPIESGIKTLLGVIVDLVQSL